MKATTIKLEGKLLEDIRRVRPANKSISAFVRELLKAQLTKQRLIQAAEQYSAFLADSSEESSFLKEWEGARVEYVPRRKGEKSKR